MTERLTTEERAVLDAARDYFNMMARMIHRAKMARRGIGSSMTLQEAAALHDDMQGHRNAVCRLDRGDALSADFREELHDIALLLATDLLSAWRCLLSEIVGGKSYVRPFLKKPSMYTHRHPSGRGWAYRRLTA